MSQKNVDPLFSDIRKEKAKLKPYLAGGQPMGYGGKFAKARYNIDGAPVEDVNLVLSRTLEPDRKYVYGVDKQPLGKIPGPYMLESEPMENYGPHRPVWRGWRPKRPEESYPELGAKMMQGERTYKIESGIDAIPTEKEIIEMAMRNSLAPYPTVPETHPIPDRYREYGIAIDETLGDIGYLGEEAGAPAPWRPFGVDVTGLVQQFGTSYAQGYSAQATEAQRQQAALTGGLPGQPTLPTRPSSEFPWGTVALVGIIGLAAAFILPKVLK
jgi:hypothetical protein